MTSLLGVVVALTASLTIPVGARAQTPTRDAGVARPATGTGSVSGTLVSDDTTNRPIRRAIVTLTLPDQRPSHLTITDDAGMFTFRNLPAGRYIITATRAGYIEATFGAKRPRGLGSAITLADGEHRRGLTMKMLRGAVISGTVRDPQGEPMPGQTVSVMGYAYAWRTGERILGDSTPRRGQTTDDRGMYRIYGLPPGDYHVLVTQGIVPRVVDAHQTTAEDVQWATRTLQQGSQPAARPLPAPASGPAVAYAPVFHPGTTSPRGAATVTVAAGEERSNVDVGMFFISTATLEGSVSMPDGTVPPALQLSLVAQDRIEGLPLSGLTTAASINGRFRFTGLAPGVYTLIARVTAPPDARGAPSAAPIAPATQALFAMEEISVSGQDRAVSVMLRSGVTVSGRLTFDASTQAPPADLSPIRVELDAVQIGRGAVPRVPAAPVNADGSFRFVGVTPGRYTLLVTGLAAAPSGDWNLKQALINSQDMLDVPLEVRTADVADLVVTMSARSSELSGRVQDAAGQPVPEVYILVFSADRTHWMPQSRRVSSRRPGSDGRYSVPNLPPGSYFLAAVTDVEPGQWFDPAYLQELMPAAIRITIGDGEKKVQDLRVGGSGP